MLNSFSDFVLEIISRPINCAFKAYRREKQKAEVGEHDPAETSWRLIKALRDRLQPGQVQKIVKKAGVIGESNISQYKIYGFFNQS